MRRGLAARTPTNRRGAASPRTPAATGGGGGGASRLRRHTGTPKKAKALVMRVYSCPRGRAPVCAAWAGGKGSPLRRGRTGSDTPATTSKKRLVTMPSYKTRTPPEAKSIPQPSDPDHKTESSQAPKPFPALRLLLRRPKPRRRPPPKCSSAPSSADLPDALASLLLASRSYAKAKGGGKLASSTTSNRGKVRAKDPCGVAAADDADGDEFTARGGGDELDAEFELPLDPLPPTYDPALDVGPGGRPLFAFADTFGSFAHRNANVYVDFT
ncbi:hypothetical protein C2845_PM03G23630 [Panicum miliaceum]|uniref:Uncharacterized protein n=1 Tax=Panicum miliaceum TaxID=4540 RepID=A0A3L6TBF2_PANMI|nr:hypothetical protein C2845_PM03G23630 [Panicum miliaceum]